MLSIRPFQSSPEAYEDLAALWNALHPEWPRHPRVWGRIDELAPSGGFRYLAELGGRLMGGIDVRPSKKGSFDLSLFARPQAGGARTLEPLYDAMCEALVPHGTVVLRAYVADCRPWLLSFFADRGLTTVQETAYSRLDVDAFDLVPHAGCAADAIRQGYRIVALTDLSESDADWQRKYWDMTCEILQEVPFEGGLQAPDLEDFAKDLGNRDHFNLAASFVALDDGAYVAGSRLKTWSELPTFAFNDLTGTRRSHRRRGLATLAKLATIAYAQQNGLRRIVTLNDVNNPMLTLNHALGFQTEHIQHTVRGELQDGERLR